jgi:DNA-binding transcriptional MerR regulator
MDRTDTAAAGADETTGELTGELTVDELAARVGVPVRTIRFYAGKRLLPPPRLEGRTGRYGPVHVARLALIRDLQAAGYTLAAVEQFLAGLPSDADADAIGLVGTLLTPWTPEAPMVLTRRELATRLDREVDDALLGLLERAQVLEVQANGRIALTANQLEMALRLLALDAPLDALVEAGDAIRRHAAALAEDLQGVFRTRIVDALGDATPADRERLRALSEALRPLTIQAIVVSYQQALEREVRGAAARR